MRKAGWGRVGAVATLLLWIGSACSEAPGTGSEIRARSGSSETLSGLRPTGSAASASPNGSASPATNAAGVVEPENTSPPTQPPQLETLPPPTPDPFRIATASVPHAGAFAQGPGGNFWVGSTDYSAASPVSRLLEVSPAGTIVASVSVSAVPAAIEVDGGGYVYTSDGKQVRRYDPSGTQVGAATISATGGRAALALDAASGRLWAIAGGEVLALSTSLAQAASYDFAATTSAQPTALALDSTGTAWVVGGPNVVKIASGSPDDAFAGVLNFNLWATKLEAVAIAPSGTWVGQSGIQIARIAADGIVTTYLPGQGAQRLAVDGAGRILATSNGQNLIVLDPATGAKLAEHGAPEGVSELLFAGSALWYSSAGAGLLTKAAP